MKKVCIRVDDELYLAFKVLVTQMDSGVQVELNKLIEKFVAKNKVKVKKL